MELDTAVISRGRVLSSGALSDLAFQAIGSVRKWGWRCTSLPIEIPSFPVEIPSFPMEMYIFPCGPRPHLSVLGRGIVPAEA